MFTAVALALHDETSRSGRIAALIIALLIILNAVAAIVETVPGLPTGFTHLLGIFEVLSIAAFSAEYFARAATCTHLPSYRRPIVGRLAYLFTPMALVDLAVLLPFFVSGMDVRTLRVLRLLRLLRLLRYEPYARSLQGFATVLRERRGELMLCALLAFGMLLVAATLMYHAEHVAQPDKLGSIPDCLWWAVIHLTTIGYGDVYPVTSAGKILAGLTAFIGVGFVTLPSTIFAMAYVAHLRQKDSVVE